MPNLFRRVIRSGTVRIAALNRDGEPYEIEAEGQLSICLEHELDHLDGIMFTDRIGPMKRLRALKEWRKAA